MANQASNYLIPYTTGVKIAKLFIYTLSYKASLNFNLEKTIMVGDRLSTDIKWGKTSGISTLLVLTGVSKEADVKHPDNEVHPDFIINSLGDLRELLKKY